MYLSTMAGAVQPAELTMYAALLTDSANSEMIEFLMAGMWILLRNADNRKVTTHIHTHTPQKTKRQYGRSLTESLSARKGAFRRSSTKAAADKCACVCVCVYTGVG